MDLSMSFCPFSLRHLRLLIALWYLPFVRWQIVYFKGDTDIAERLTKS
jgi:hypothetical protein